MSLIYTKVPVLRVCMRMLNSQASVKLKPFITPSSNFGTFLSYQLIVPGLS